MHFHIRYYNLHDICNWSEHKNANVFNSFLFFDKEFLYMGVKRTPIFWTEGYDDTSDFVTCPRKYDWRCTIWSLPTEEFNRYM